jgi:hypothetical protein
MCILFLTSRPGNIAFYVRGSEQKAEEKNDDVRRQSERERVAAAALEYF